MRYIVALSFVAVLAVAGGGLVLHAQEDTAAPAIADEFAREALTAPSASEPENTTVAEPSDESADIIEQAGGSADSGMAETPVGPRLVVDGEVVSTADAVDAIETVEESAGILRWLHLLIVALVPVAILGLKKVADKLPPHYLPMIAPLLGLVADAIGSLASGTNANPLVGALAGAAAVGVREVYDQWKKRNWARVTSPEVKP